MDGRPSLRPRSGEVATAGAQLCGGRGSPGTGVMGHPAFEFKDAVRPEAPPDASLRRDSLGLAARLRVAEAALDERMKQRSTFAT